MTKLAISDRRTNIEGLDTPRVNDVHVVILAAGKGTRMKSETPKVLHTIGGLTIIDVPDRETAKVWAGKIAEGCGWPQDLREFKPGSERA